MNLDEVQPETGNIRLVIISGHLSGKSVVLPPKVFVIGNGGNCHLLVESPLVSKANGTRLPGKGNETLLLVDDEDAVRGVAEGVLKHHGYQILCAKDGMDALDVYEKHKDAISLVLLDLTMPKLSGQQTLVELRQRYGNVPVIVCSGYLVDLHGFEEETGFRPEAAIQKPYNIKDLARKVREVLDHVASGAAPVGDLGG